MMGRAGDGIDKLPGAQADGLQVVNATVVGFEDTEHGPAYQIQAFRYVEHRSVHAFSPPGRPDVVVQ